MHRRKFLSLLLMIGATGCVGQSSTSQGPESSETSLETLSRWVKDSANPVINTGNSGEWDSAHVFNPTMVVDSGTVHTLYGGRSESGPNQIGHASSEDVSNWKKSERNPVISPKGNGWMSTSVNSPSIMKIDDQFHAFFSGRNSDGVKRIGHATSDDLVNWQLDVNNPVLEPTERWEKAKVNDPSVIRVGDEYYMAYRGYSGQINRIGMAKSDDLSNWEKFSDNPVLTLGGVGQDTIFPLIRNFQRLMKRYRKIKFAWDDTSVCCPDLLKIDDTIHMFYAGAGSGTSRTGHATSSDLHRWQRNPNNPVLGVGSGDSWDRGDMGAPAVIRKNDTFHMLYQGESAEHGTFRIGHAFATPP